MTKLIDFVAVLPPLFVNFKEVGFLALRVAIAAIFFTHSNAKMAMWNAAPSEQMTRSNLYLSRFLAVAETFGAMAIALGFLAQFAAIGLGLIMIGAIYKKMFAWKTPFMASQGTGWELDLIILAACVALVVFGGGTWTLDRLFFRI